MKDSVLKGIFHDRPYAHIGRLLSGWAIIEVKMDRAIAEALGLNLVQFQLFRSVLTWRQKLNVLRVLVKLVLKSEDEKTHYLDVIAQIERERKTRNIMAHRMFAPTEDGASVNFYGVEVKKNTVELPKTEWSEQDFSKFFQTQTGFFDELDNLQSSLKRSKAVVKRGKLTPYWG